MYLYSHVKIVDTSHWLMLHKINASEIMNNTSEERQCKPSNGRQACGSIDQVIVPCDEAFGGLCKS